MTWPIHLPPKGRSLLGWKDKFELTIALQIGKNANGTLRHGIRLLLNSSDETLKKAGRELQIATEVLNENGLVDKATMLNDVFWIHKPQVNEEGIAIFLKPNALRRNFIEGLLRKGLLKSPNIKLDEIHEETFLEVIANTTL
ncbi:MAG: hypothetical protein ACXAB4_12430 [Candidatus Hodarchaeales archaeon]